MCPTNKPKCGTIDASLQLIGDKWSGLIIRDLTGGPKRFTELEQDLGIGPRTLSQRLECMLVAGVVVKKQFAEVPPHTEYSLTKKGEDLLPILRSMAAWDTKYSAH